jgi:phage N-6-adenine-methyltransferase
MKQTDTIFKSNTAEWGTPQDLFDRLNEEFQFDVDVCATADNKKVFHFFDRVDDGLKQEWKGVCWCNPPYGRNVGDWLRKAYHSALRGATVVVLVPARTDTRWWHQWVEGKATVRFIQGRLRFEGGEKYSVREAAPFPSAILVYR